MLCGSSFLFLIFLEFSATCRDGACLGVCVFVCMYVLATVVVAEFHRVTGEASRQNVFQNKTVFNRNEEGRDGKKP